MPNTSAQTLGNDAALLLGAIGIGQTLDAENAAICLRFLNDLLDEWGNRTAMIPFVSRWRFTLTAGKGGPTNPYTIGPGGNFDTARPSNQSSIVSANLILTATTPEVRVPLGIYTDDAYNANQLPTMSNTQPTALYYNPTYVGDLGSVSLWPVPSIATNDLEVFLQQGVAAFANWTTSVAVPSGLIRALKYNLALALQPVFGKEAVGSLPQLAISSLAAFTRANLNLSDLATDATGLGSRRTLYNIQTGFGGG